MKLLLKNTVVTMMRIKERSTKTMKQVTQKRILVSVIVICAVLGWAYRPNAARIDKLEQDMEHFKEVEYTLPPATPQVVGNGLTLTCDVLYWYPRVNGTAFAYLTENSASHRETKDLNFDWCFAWRINVGKALRFDHWDIRAGYLYSRNRLTEKIGTDPSTSLIPTRGERISQTGVTHAQSSYRLDFHNVDVELGRQYYTSNYLTLRPSIGVKSVWIDQAQAIQYTGGDLYGNTAHINDQCDYWGIGAKGGVDSSWSLGHGWAIDGLLSGCMLYGFFDTEHTRQVTPNPQVVHYDNNKHAFIPMVHWRLGLSWGTHVNQKAQYIGAGISYEGMYWWRQNQMLKIYESSPARYESVSEDLSMHGLMLSATVSF